jgi:hypothetical protein
MTPSERRTFRLKARRRKQKHRDGMNTAADKLFVKNRGKKKKHGMSETVIKAGKGVIDKKKQSAQKSRWITWWCMNDESTFQQQWDSLQSQQTGIS